MKTPSSSFPYANASFSDLLWALHEVVKAQDEVPDLFLLNFAGQLVLCMMRDTLETGSGPLHDSL